MCVHVCLDGGVSLCSFVCVRARGNEVFVMESSAHGRNVVTIVRSGSTNSALDRVPAPFVPSVQLWACGGGGFSGSGKC